MLTGFLEFFGEQLIEDASRNQSECPTSGCLIVFEGIDGAGKSTQVDRLIHWLKKDKHHVCFTKWNSSKLMTNPIDKAKDKRMLSPLLYSLMHATDMAVRYENDIVPALRDNKIVVCDRYIYTSKVRDQARGVDEAMLDKIYQGWRKPDVLLHCNLPIKVAKERLMKEKGLSYYGSGMDLNLANSKEENYVKYATLMDKLYNRVLPGEKGYHKIDMNQDREAIAENIKKVVEAKLKAGKYV